MELTAGKELLLSCGESSLQMQSGSGDIQMYANEVKLESPRNATPLDLLSQDEVALLLSEYEKQKTDYLTNNILYYMDQLYSSIELQRLLKEKRAKLKECGDDLLDYSPSLYIDLDHKTLNSLFPEPASYEDYVPDTWEGKYEDFTQYISSENRYWINESGQIC